MTNQIVTSSDEEDSDMSPAASLTAIPVRRRRKRGGASPALKKLRQSEPEPSPVTPRKETFGKADQHSDPKPAYETSPVIAAANATITGPANSADSGMHDEAVGPGSGSLPAEAIIELWESLADEEPFPALMDLDVSRVATHWPNSLLLRATGNPRRPDVEVIRVFSANSAEDAPHLPIDTMTIDWMMALAREVIYDGAPVHELDDVSADNPTIEYGVIALPFGSGPDSVDHVLCHLYRYEGPPDDAPPERDTRERSLGPKSGRKIIATIFGRRQTVAG